MVRGIAGAVAMAMVPDQLLGYVNAIARFKTSSCGEGILHNDDENGILVVFPAGSSNLQSVIDRAVGQALEDSRLKTLTVLAPVKPGNAPEDASVKTDQYWFLKLPATPGAKTRNMLRAARRNLAIARDNWMKAHADLVEAFCADKKTELDDGTCFIFSRLENYLATNPETLLFSARDPDGSLAAFAIGDFTAMRTAFYMFAFRKRTAPPGAADLLLQSIVDEAYMRGMENLNLGLGIQPGIEFFKKKWGAVPMLPYVETSWQIRKKSFLARIFGR